MPTLSFKCRSLFREQGETVMQKAKSEAKQSNTFISVEYTIRIILQKYQVVQVLRDVISLDNQHCDVLIHSRIFLGYHSSEVTKHIGGGHISLLPFLEGHAEEKRIVALEQWNHYNSCQLAGAVGKAACLSWFE